MPTSSLRAICLWSGPRNVSTALMYSFAQHEGIQIVDEPLYGHYLRVSGAEHPGRDIVMAAMNCDGNTVLAELLERQSNSRKRLFMKHMAHHLVDIDRNVLSATQNLFLIRDPQEMLPSLTIQLPTARLADTGLKTQYTLYCALADAGQRPVVIDSRELLLDPRETLEALCEHLGIEFSTAMLRWPAGPRPEDGIWAPYWYDAVHRSTGFEPYRPKQSFPEHLGSLLAECKPWYDKLYAHALRTGAEGV